VLRRSVLLRQLRRHPLLLIEHLSAGSMGWTSWQRSRICAAFRSSRNPIYVQAVPRDFVGAATIEARPFAAIAPMHGSARFVVPPVSAAYLFAECANFERHHENGVRQRACRQGDGAG
jgi:hypothetical protein